MNDQKLLVDEYGNIHYRADKFASGGQGGVFHTGDPDLAIKQPLNMATGEADYSINLRNRFRNIRILPLPPRIPISLPLSTLRDEPGYVMRLLSDMKPFSNFDADGKTKNELSQQTLPKWLENLGKVNNKYALRLFYYSATGSTRRRLFALSKCASILARLHYAGLVYGDISSNNVFVGEGENPQVWLIDADNLRFEGGNPIFTPEYGAPEIVQKRDKLRPRTDCWAFAVLAFKTLTLCHPFIGKKVLEPDDDEGGWDAESATTQAAGDLPADLDERAYAGYFPFIDDIDDDSNAYNYFPPRQLVATPAIRQLFQETFGIGRTQPHRRPAMAFWALELAKAFDHSLDCANCGMSFFADDFKKCPYCDTPRSSFVRLRTDNWEIIISANTKEFSLPHRLFHPFSFQYNSDTEYEAVLDFSEKSVTPVRGTKPFPENMIIEFIGGRK